MEKATRALHAINEQAPVPDRIVVSALLLCAVARAARAVPELNGFWTDEQFQPASDVHPGTVVSLREGGILVPTIPDADRVSPAQMMHAMREAVGRTRTGRLRSRDTTQATITVTNLGDLGADAVFGVIPIPQVAIVGFGAVTERPCAGAGLVGVRPQVTVTLSAGHRASDGAVGARFLHRLTDHLQHPEELWIMTAGITSRADAAALVRRSLQGFATHDEITGLDEHQPLRSTLEIDSIDFLTFVERLSAGSGCRIDEDDYPRLATIESCADFLTTPGSGPTAPAAATEA